MCQCRLQIVLKSESSGLAKHLLPSKAGLRAIERFVLVLWKGINSFSTTNICIGYHVSYAKVLFDTCTQA